MPKWLFQCNELGRRNARRRSSFGLGQRRPVRLGRNVRLSGRFTLGIGKDGQWAPPFSMGLWPSAWEIDASLCKPPDWLGWRFAAAWHKPLYRQGQIMKLQGLPADRSTLALWVGVGAHVSSTAILAEPSRTSFRRR